MNLLAGRSLLPKRKRIGPDGADAAYISLKTRPG
jgi:hypothetical protein